jgi:hypothetical protein
LRNELHSVRHEPEVQSRFIMTKLDKVMDQMRSELSL